MAAWQRAGGVLRSSRRLGLARKALQLWTLAMAAPHFQIEIIDQGWLAGCSATDDLCSHGRIRLTVGGVPVSTGEMQYGISESALALLRTLEADHSKAHRVAERLIFHGCGAILMMGCPIGIDWSVHHSPGRVRITEVVRYDSTDEAAAVRFGALILDLPEYEYRREVVAFATEAKRSFVGVPKRFFDPFDEEQYQWFWDEYDALLDHYRDGGKRSALHWGPARWDGAPRPISGSHSV
jgi:hypothetical protein